MDHVFASTIIAHALHPSSSKILYSLEYRCLEGPEVQTQTLFDVVLA